MELAEIRRMSETDPLTGLYNRRGFENGLQGVLSSYTDGMTISLASIDMDNLKMINDIWSCRRRFCIEDIIQDIEFMP